MVRIFVTMLLSAEFDVKQTCFFLKFFPGRRGGSNGAGDCYDDHHKSSAIR
jgi:hypothetical protein